MPPATIKRRHQLEPISYDELMSNAGMSGFVSFLEGGVRGTATAPVTVVDRPPVPGQPPFRWASNGRGRQSRIWKATMVEDGHSLAEQAVYDALWSRAAT